MDMEDVVARKTYILLLIETIEKKKKILSWLQNVTKQQEMIIITDPFDEQLFEETIGIKEKHLNELKLLDDGFEGIYNGIRNEISENKEKYKIEIDKLKKLIAEVTDISMELQALEKRNKSKLNVLFSKKRTEIRDLRMSSKMVTNYYKNMANQQESQSFFYDKKK